MENNQENREMSIKQSQENYRQVYDSMKREVTNVGHLIGELRTEELQKCLDRIFVVPDETLQMASMKRADLFVEFFQILAMALDESKNLVNLRRIDPHPAYPYKYGPEEKS